ncbi:MAG: hypothetical protein LBV68_06970 [Spirochaetaceae bacterium]|jgi:electron transport complex protein RnfA|nr:hypothetical protein [Spirochaetaceae bacterium]
MNASLSLLVLSGLFLNLPLQLGLGIKEIWRERNRPFYIPFFECLVLFLSIIIQWLLFSFIFSPLNLGFLKYFFIFPLSTGISTGFELVFSLLSPQSAGKHGKIFSFSALSGLSIAAVLLVLFLADTVGDALILDLGFSAGVYISMIILKAIRIRISDEKKNPFFSGIPLLFISMGLLSLVWTSAAIIYLSTQGIF